jgi:hypothetical protein
MCYSKNKAMKRIISLLIVCAISLTTVTAQMGGGSLSLSDLQGPKAKWAAESFDFGQIKQNIPVEATFELENIGTGPMIIQRVESSCGCTTADYRRSPIMPGEKTTVGATFDAKAMGQFSKSITVTLNDGNQPYILRFSGAVVK